MKSLNQESEDTSESESQSSMTSQKIAFGKLYFETWTTVKINGMIRFKNCTRFSIRNCIRFGIERLGSV